jgi:hypothetical protein
MKRHLPSAVPTGRRWLGSRADRVAGALLLAVTILAVSAAAVVHAASAPRSAGVAGLLRGPYLQVVTDRSAVVRWRTLQATGSRVEWGSAPGELDRVAADPTPTTEHAVRLDGLAPATRYYYAVGDDAGSTVGDAGFRFVTAPMPGERVPFRAWVVGDSGTGEAPALAVRDGFVAWAGERGADLWLMLGDNAYTYGTDAEYQRGLFDAYPGLLRRLPLWPALGNHDGYSADSAAGTGPYYDIFELPADGEAGGVASGTEAYYSYDYANVHFVCLESYSLDRSPGGPMLTWLATDLAATTADWIVAYWHHPPYSKGSHDSDVEQPLREMRRNVVPILEAYGVDLVLAGHSHAYERSFLVDGHYGSSLSFSSAFVVDGGDGREDGDGAYVKGGGGHRGTVYVVAGSAARLGGGNLDHPAMAVSMRRYGSLVLDFGGHRLDAVFVDEQGVARDHFSIVKPGLLLRLDTPPPAPGLRLDRPR